MSQFVLYCNKTNAQSKSITEHNILTVLNRLTPDNLTPNPPKVIEQKGLLIGILNPVSTLSIDSGAICLGHLYDDTSDWKRMGTTTPNGTYAIIRYDDKRIELVSDVMGTRTIWYYHDEERLIASNSQRAIIMLLKSFEPNYETSSWMISSGTLGPYLSWDKRISQLPGSSIFALDRFSWEGSLNTQKHTFSPQNGSYSQFKKSYKFVLENHVGKVEFDPKYWIFPLSGGYDSRSLLIHSDSIKKLHSITWGREEDKAIPFTDGRIGVKLAKHYGLDHHIYFLKQSTEDIEKVISRFVKQGEARTDKLGGYIDGFHLWKNLFEKGFSGYIRGDQPYCADWARNAFEVRDAAILFLFKDIDNSNRFLDWGFEDQKIPEEFEQLPGEHLMDWKDRLYQLFCIPAINAPLSFLKSAYLETSNPFFHDEVVNLIKGMPFEYRLKKELFWRITRAQSPRIPFAHRNTGVSLSFLSHSKEMWKLIIETLGSSQAETIIPKGFINYIIEHFECLNHSFYDLPEIAPASLKNSFRALIPKIYYRKYKKVREHRREIEMYQLAFRGFMIVKMHELLVEDARQLTQPQPKYDYQ